MNSRLLTTVAAAALIAGATVASAQTGSGQSGSSPGAAQSGSGGGGSGTMERGAAQPREGTSTQEKSTTSTQEKSAPKQRTGQSRDGQSRDAQPGQGQAQAPRRGDQMQGQREGTGQMQGQREGSGAVREQGQVERQGAGQQDRQGAGQRGQAEPGRAGPGGRAETTGRAPADVQISTEQRTQIRQRLGANPSARLDRASVNFSLSVGATVPRTVRVLDLPPDIVTIVPAYRGYKYVVVEEEILIIDPRTWRIVYIIEA